MTEEEITRGRHIGDGVYISFDGYQFWIAVNHHSNRVAALEPRVLDELNRYAKELAQFYRDKEKASGA